MLLLISKLVFNPIVNGRREYVLSSCMISLWHIPPTLSSQPISYSPSRKNLQSHGAWMELLGSLNSQSKSPMKHHPCFLDSTLVPISHAYPAYLVLGPDKGTSKSLVT